MSFSFERASLSVVALAALTLVGCANQAPTTASKAASTYAAAPAKAEASASEYYVVLTEEGRFYAFGDFKTYQQFLAHGEVALTRTRIGAGPDGKTVVFGLTKADVKANKPTKGELVFDGKLSGGTDFYGEVFKEGRFYVFDDLKDMKEFAAVGEVPYAFTDIGTGPQGKSLVWVMNKTSIKEGRPEARIARFKTIRAAN